MAKVDKAPPYVSVTVNKEKSFIALKLVVSTDIWDFGKGPAKGSGEEAKLLMLILITCAWRSANCYKELLLKGKLITAKAVKVFTFATFLYLVATSNKTLIYS